MLKPQNDKSEYLTYQLDNGLRVFIVQDLDTKESASAMRVNIGCNQDSIPGQAHLLEHMLFNGTEKYPKENEFKEFVSKNGGSTNAYTTHDNTCYYYTVAPNKAIGALEMFGDFFVSPTLDPNSIDREKEAVNSEHEKNILDDSRIRYNLLQRAFDPDNLFCKFGTGCNETLAIGDIGYKIREFYETFYSAHLMTLTVISRENIDIIKKSIDNIYGKIRSHGTPNLINDIPFFTHSKFIRSVSVKKENCIIFSWNVPSYKNTPKEDPLGFISHLMGNETHDTIYQILLEKKYIKSLYSSTSTSGESYRIFRIQMGLTGTGMNHLEDIASTIYKYIAMIVQNIDDEQMNIIYEEGRSISEYRNTFAKKQPPRKKVLNLCNRYNSIKIDPNEILIINSLDEPFNKNVKENMLNILKEMNPDRCVVMLSSQEHKNDDLLLDLKYYNAKYSITDEKLTSIESNKNIVNKFFLPIPRINPYISTGVEMINETESSLQLLRNDKVIGYWNPDISFQTPDVCIIMDVLLTNIKRTEKDLMTAILYFSTVKECAKKITYLMDDAEYNIDIDSSDFISCNKLSICISGNYCKIKNIHQEIIDIIKNQKLDQNIFELKKTMIKMNGMNHKYNSPYTKLGSFLLENLWDVYIHPDRRGEVIENITFDDISKIKEELFMEGEIIMLVSGNIGEKDAKEIIDNTEKLISNHSNDIHQVINFPTQFDQEYINKTTNEKECNSALSNYIYIATINSGNFEDFCHYPATLNILHSIIRPNFFDALRTKECYGYIVSSSSSNMESVYSQNLYYKFLVQSSKKDCDNISQRIVRYIIESKEIIKNKTQKDIDDIVVSFVEKLKAPYETLYKKSYHTLYKDINKNKIHDFNKSLIECYQKINVNDIIQFYEDKFINRKSMVIGLDKN